MPSFDTEAVPSLKPTTLNQLRWSGKVPKYVRIEGRTIRYRHQDLHHWVNSCTGSTLLH